MSLTRNSTGLLYRELDFASFSLGTGWAVANNPTLITFGHVPQVLLAPRTVGSADYDGVREGQLVRRWQRRGICCMTRATIRPAGGSGIATSSDRGLTWSKAVQSIQLRQRLGRLVGRDRNGLDVEMVGRLVSASRARLDLVPSA
jgi:hypothetical protein